KWWFIDGNTDFKAACTLTTHKIYGKDRASAYISARSRFIRLKNCFFHNLPLQSLYVYLQYKTNKYSGLTKTSTALSRLAVLSVLSAASSPCPDFC
ncbi:TPA: hypothetical protein ACFPBP_000646, partial [Neisseria meningitidis]